MRRICGFIVLLFVFISVPARAFQLFADALYWKAAESVDWVVDNNLSSTQQMLHYKIIDFPPKFGFRVGASSQGIWSNTFDYTQYKTYEKARTSGNLTSAFAASRIQTLPKGFFYSSGDVNFKIRYDMFDEVVSRAFPVTDRLTLSPVLGLKGGRINQHVQDSFEGAVSSVERVNNDFSGIGPQLGINGQWIFYQSPSVQWSLYGNFATSALWGYWRMKDVLHDSFFETTEIAVGSREFAAVMFQALVGLEAQRGKCSMRLGYEINDWLNQGQFFDNATGSHSNNLIFKGANLRFTYTV
jgi:hypothetical protein